MIDETVAYIQTRLPFTPEIGIILGSGLGDLASAVENPIFLDYGTIPHFPLSTAPGHKGRFVAGFLAHKPVICMQGRFHYYEGYTMEQVIYPVRVLKRLGVQTLILTNAAGGICQDFSVGDLMLIEDHINVMGTNPLIGRNDPSFGPRFCDMTYAYTPKLRALAEQTAAALNIPLQHGVYLACTGPSFETPAEIHAFRTLGADAVGMSTVPEVIAASHCQMNVLAISMITNMAAGVLDQPLSGDEVIEIGNLRSRDMQRLISEIVRNMEGTR